MPKRKKGGHEAGLELESGGMMRWLLTYADLITLLLATFIILYATQSQSKAVVEAIKAQIRAVFGPIEGNTQILPNQGSNPGVHYKVLPGEPEQGGPSGVKKFAAKGTGGEMEKKLGVVLQQQIGANKVLIRKEARGLVISLLTDKVLFDIGDTRLKAEMKEILSNISGVLKQYPQKQIVVEGHTDDLSISGGKIHNNWELSALRSTAVVSYLAAEKGLDPSRLSAVGYSEFQPLVPNISETNRRLNRRVDIVIMKLE